MHPKLFCLLFSHFQMVSWISSCSFILFTSPTLRCSVQRPQPVLYYTMHSKQSIKTEAPPHMPVSAMYACVCVRLQWSLCVELTSWVKQSVFSVMLWLKSCLQLLLLYLYLRSLSAARTATLLTMSRPSKDSIWSDLRKRTGTITLFSFFRWVPSERRKEGRGEEVNKPSAFLQKNKETLDRHLYFSMK